MRSSVVLCFMYDAKPFAPSKRVRKPEESMSKAGQAELAKLMEQIAEAREVGVENWQVNLKLTPTQVEVVAHFKLGSL